MLGDQGAPDLSAVRLHGFDGLKPVSLAGVAERDRTCGDAASHTFGRCAHAREQRFPFSSMTRLASGESRKGQAQESRGEDCRSEQHDARCLPAGFNTTTAP
jgi:hypothetical protein